MIPQQKILGPTQYLIQSLMLSIKGGGAPVLVDAQSKEVETVAYRYFKSDENVCDVTCQSGWFVPIGPNQPNKNFSLAERNPEPHRILIVRAKLIPKQPT